MHVQVVRQLHEKYPIAISAACDKHAAELANQARRLDKKKLVADSAPRLVEVRDLMHFVVRSAL